METYILEARKQCGNWSEEAGCCLDDNPEDCPYFEECSSAEEEEESDSPSA